MTTNDESNAQRLADLIWQIQFGESENESETARRNLLELIEDKDLPTITNLIRIGLNSVGPNGRIQLLLTLVDLGPKAADSLVADVEERLSDEFPAVRALASLAFWKLTGEAETVLPVLLSVLKVNEPKHRQAAWWVIGQMAGRAVFPMVERLLELADDADANTRTYAFAAISRIHEAAKLEKVRTEHSPLAQEIIGVWAPAAGDARETIEYRADGAAHMKMFGTRKKWWQFWK